MSPKNKMLSFAAACSLLVINAAHAAVTATFTQVGNDVQVTWSGSYDVPTPNETFQISQGTDGYSGFGTTSYTYLIGANGGESTNAVVVGGEIFTVINIAEIAGTYTGTTFGYDLQGDDVTTQGCIILPKDYAGNQIYTPVGTMTFANRTVQGMFGSNLPNNYLAFRGEGSVAGSREIYITVVPEPSSSLLLGMFATAALFTRKRATR